MPGGVCQILDYEVEVMADYVAEMSMRVVMPQSNITPGFRKYTSQILSSTRLPSTTILLGMNYLAKRMNIRNSSGVQHGTNEGEVWRLLTVGLLLASKFLDDNTFQNRSWSEVSGINVRELNNMENEWLRDVNWCLYVNFDRSQDYNAWLDNWRQWQEDRKMSEAAAAAAASSLAAVRSRGHITPDEEPYVRRPWQEPQRSFHYVDTALRYEQAHRAAQDSKYIASQWKMMAGNNYQNIRTQRPSQLQIQPVQPPITPPDSAYGTPEYLNSATSTGSHPGDWFGQAHEPNSYARNAQAAVENVYHASRHAAKFPSGYWPPAYNTWDHVGRPDCTCHHCIRRYEHKQSSFFSGPNMGLSVYG